MFLVVSPGVRALPSLSGYEALRFNSGDCTFMLVSFLLRIDHIDGRADHLTFPPRSAPIEFQGIQ